MAPHLSLWMSIPIWSLEIIFSVVLRHFLPSANLEHGGGGSVLSQFSRAFGKWGRFGTPKIYWFEYMKRSWTNRSSWPTECSFLIITDRRCQPWCYPRSEKHNGDIIIIIIIRTHQHVGLALDAYAWRFRPVKQACGDLQQWKKAISVGHGVDMALQWAYFPSSRLGTLLKLMCGPIVAAGCHPCMFESHATKCCWLPTCMGSMVLRCLNQNGWASWPIVVTLKTLASY